MSVEDQNQTFSLGNLPSIGSGGEGFFNPENIRHYADLSSRLGGQFYSQFAPLMGGAANILQDVLSGGGGR